MPRRPVPGLRPVLLLLLPWSLACTANATDGESGGGSGGTVASGGAGGKASGGSGGNVQAGASGGGSGGNAQAGAGGTAGSSGGGTGGAGGKASGGSAGTLNYGGGQGTECGGTSVPMGSGGPSGGQVGVWSNVTPGAVSLDHNNPSDNYGAQDVLVDPARPSDFYAFFCHQGVYKSTDYGQTWAKVNTGTNGDKIDSGKPWGEGIDSNRCRDPQTPPTLYSAGSQGAFWRSTDGGVNWETFNLPDDGKPRAQDAYNVDVNPYNGQHLIVGYHEQTGLSESTDGGETWRAVPLDSGMADGASFYGFFIDTGDPATTNTTWLMIAQATGGGIGTWRTSDAGASWDQVDSNEHPHGQTQLFQDSGIVYMAGVYGEGGWGVHRSTDFGANFTHVGPNAGMGLVFGTPNYVYGMPSGASAGGVETTSSQRAPSPGTTWTGWPQTMTNGPKRAGISHDGSNYIIVGGNWLAGVWRYVEPAP